MTSIDAYMIATIFLWANEKTAWGWLTLVYVVLILIGGGKGLF